MKPWQKWTILLLAIAGVTAAFSLTFLLGWYCSISRTTEQRQSSARAILFDRSVEDKSVRSLYFTFPSTMDRRDVWITIEGVELNLSCIEPTWNPELRATHRMIYLILVGRESYSGYIRFSDHSSPLDFTIEASEVSERWSVELYRSDSGNWEVWSNSSSRQLFY